MNLDINRYFEYMFICLFIYLYIFANANVCITYVYVIYADLCMYVSICISNVY